jgi:MoaA/NifB/PqqE/SkfB family radical SAM enzyme
MGEVKEAAEDRAYDLASPFLLTPGGTRLIEIHPTRRCNLRCQHCYSQSGPDRRDDLPYEPLKTFLAQARELGYNYAGVSGGEPLLWKDLDRFLELAATLRFATSITTNGTLLDRSRAAGLRGRVGLVAVSVDGPPEDHARMRGSDSVFASMRAGVSALAQERVPFALAFTLTRYNAHQLTWLIGFAREVGALAVHVHPLCDFGAASEHLADAVPDSLEFRAAGWLLALLVQEDAAHGPAVTMDAIRRRVVQDSCWPMVAGSADDIASAPFADLVPSLVIDTAGSIVPFIYGFPTEWSIGRIGAEPLASAAAAWRTRCALRIAAMIRLTLDRLASAGEDYIDLFGELLATAHARRF